MFEQQVLANKIAMERIETDNYSILLIICILNIITTVY